MKKIFITSIICFCLVATVHGQKLRKKEARQIIENAITSLKTSDSLSFVKLWYFDGKPEPYHSKPFTESSATSYYHQIKEWIDTALVNNYKVDFYEISKVEKGEQSDFGIYNVKAWFKYNDKYYKAFGFYLDFIDNKWVVKYMPETSTMNRS